MNISYISKNRNTIKVEFFKTGSISPENFMERLIVLAQHFVTEVF